MARKKTPSSPGGQAARTFHGKVVRRVSFRYLLFLPKGYGKTAKRWPLILFLHGAGERGNDINLVKKHGPPKIVDGNPNFPFILVSPQCPADRGWEAHELVTLLDHIEQNYAVDPARVYLTGMSMGGYGTWELAKTCPERFAAIAPICGGGAPSWTWRIWQLPTWVFHGTLDTTVPLTESRVMVEAIKRRGGKPRFTVYRTAGHDSWTKTYNNPELYEWFLAQRTK